MRRQPLAVRVGDDAALRDAQQRIMRLVEVAVREIGVVGRDQRHDRAHRRDRPARLRCAPPPACRGAAARCRAGPGKAVFRASSAASAASDLPLGKQAPDRPAGTAREADQALVRRGEIGRRHGRLGAGFAVEIGAARQPDQVAVAGLALRQQDDAVRLGGMSVDRPRRAGALAAVISPGASAISMPMIG